MEAEGWYYDPFGVHEQRWYSAGNPTSLVRDGAAETRDEPPAVDSSAPLVALRVDERAAPLTTTLGPPPYGGYVAIPDPRESRRVQRRIGFVTVLSAIAAGLAFLAIFSILDPRQAWPAAGIAALVALYIGYRCASISRGVQFWRANRDADWSNDLYPR